jgi:hypothetical protein
MKRASAEASTTAEENVRVTRKGTTKHGFCPRPLNFGWLNADLATRAQVDKLGILQWARANGGKY